MAAETKVENRLSFNPEWMETPAEVPPLLLRSSSSSNDINVPMCPPKLANFRYGREEMLALCPEKLPDIQELSDQFPEFHSVEPLPPVCFQQYTEEEERLLMQGVNSSKVIAAVNHVEKASRWSTGSRGFPRGLGSTGMERSDMFAPPRERIEPPSRFAGVRFTGDTFRERGGGRGRGGEGRGRFDDGNYVRPGRGGYENVGNRPGYEGLGKSPLGFEERNRVGKPAAESDNWRSTAEPPTNARAQGLYEANEYPERRRPKPRVLSHSAEEDDSENRSQRYRTKSQSGGGTGIPEWAAEYVSDDESGSFDASGQFKTAKEVSNVGERKNDVKSANSEEKENKWKEKASVDKPEDDKLSAPVPLAKSQDVPAVVSKQQLSAENSQSLEQRPLLKTNGNKSSDANENRFSPLNRIWDTSVTSEGKLNAESTASSNSLELKRMLGLTSAATAAETGLPAAPLQQSVSKESNVAAAESEPRDFFGSMKGRFKATEMSSPSDQTSSTAVNSSRDERRPNAEGPRPNSLAMDRSSGNSALSASWAGAPPNLLATSANQKAAADHPSLGKTDLSASYPLGSLLSGIMSAGQQKEQLQMGRESATAGNFGVQKSQSLTSDQMRDKFNPNIVRRQQKSSSPSEIEFEKLHKDMESFIDTVGNDDSQSSSFMRQSSTSSNTETDWFYLDPQSNVQGPFNSRKMNDWFNTGYFTMNLLVRRGNDRQFSPLGDLIKTIGKVPFVDKDSSATTPTTPLVPTVQSVVQQKTDTPDGRSLLEELQKRQMDSLRLKQQQASQGNPSPSPMKSIWGAEVQNVLEQPAVPNYSSGPSSVPHPSLQRLQAIQQMQVTEQQLEQERQRREREVAMRDQQLRAMELNMRQQEERRKEEEMKAHLEFEQKRRAEEERLMLMRQEEEQRRMLDDLARKQSEERRRKELEDQKRREEEEDRRQQESERRRLEEQQRIAEYETRRQSEEEARKREEQRAQERLKFEKREAERQRKAAAAWALPQSNASTVSLAEVQKQEMVQGSESRYNQPPPQQPTSPMWQTLAEVEKFVPAPKWQPSAPLPVSPRVQSLLDIQLEEQRQMEAEQRQVAAMESHKKETLKGVNLPAAGVWNNPTKLLSWKKASSPWTTDDRADSDDAGGNTGFWDEPKAPVSQPISPAKRPQNRSSTAPAPTREKNSHMPSLFKTPCVDEFTGWCAVQIQSLNVDIDAPMLATFLKDVESPDEVENYVVGYCGQGKAVKEFVKAFLLKRSQLKQKRVDSADDLLKPATALMPHKSDPLQSVTNNGNVAGVGSPNDTKAAQQAAKKKKKTGKKLMDTSVLGFMASADPNRLNVGEIDSHM